VEASGEGLAERSVAIECSLDGGGSWTEIARDRPSSGRCAWDLPRADTERALVRVRATTAQGVSGAAKSKRPFVIDSTPPRAVVRVDPAAQENLAPVASSEPPPAVAAAGSSAPAPGGGSARARAASPAAVVRARDHLARGSPRAISLARELMEEFVAREPSNAEANVLLGEARARETERLAKSEKLSPQELLRRYAEAAAALRAALAVKPEADERSPPRLRNSGRFWLGMCHFHRARIFYRQLRQRDDAMAEAELAAAEFELSLGLHPNPADEHYYAAMANYMLAMAGPEADRRERSLRAEELFEKTLVPPDGRASESTAASAHWYLALLAERSRNRPKGIEHARKALEKFGPKSAYAPQIRELIRRMGGR
jgi:hypothetical protein